MLRTPTSGETGFSEHRGGCLFQVAQRRRDLGHPHQMMPLFMLATGSMAGGPPALLQSWNLAIEYLAEYA
jgi:hypothetical protein